MMKKKGELAAGTVLIVAPIGKDAVLAADALANEGIPACACANLVALASELSSETAVVLVAEEALVASELPGLLKALDQQPPWSDIPVIILTSSGGSDRMSLEAVDIFGPAGNVTLLERPLRSVTLVSAVKVALRARERQHEVRALIEQRETVLTGISDAFAALDHEWRYTYVNDKAAEYAQMHKDQMIGRSIWDVYPEAVGGTFYSAVHRAAETQTPQHFEQYYDRWKCWMETRVYPTADGVAVFRANINERKEQEAIMGANERKLQENETLLRLAIEAADAGTFDYYPLTGEVRWSDRCKELFGMAHDAEVTYDAYLNAVHPDDRHIVTETVRAVHQPGSSGRYDIEYRTIGVTDREERWVAEKGRALFDGDGRVTRFIGTILNVTERKNAELVLERAKREAEEANRAKDQFLAMLSHELRTPLTPVLMMIASLQRDPHISDDLRRDLEVLQRNVELEALLIDDLLDLTRIAHGKLELHYDAVDIHSSLEHALSITHSDIDEKQLTIDCHFDAREHHSWADGARLQQVFWNLIKNAVKFTPAGGRLQISTRNDQDHHIVIDVADTGIGIEPELLPRIFDAFEQGGRNVTSQFGGLGLGLAISKRVVDMHGGTIGVASGGHGQGATFTVTIGAMETSLLEGPVLYADAQSRRASRGNILLVEDHEDTARVLGRILQSGGYTVARAATVAAAKQLGALRRFDLVISDVGLPDGSGLDLMRHLQKAHGLIGIALSGFGTEDDIGASLNAGFAEHLTKPVDWERLKAAIERLTREQPAVAKAATS
jgi:PAS domain S-box-containing protein